jgi:hypothetical protein
MKMILKKNLKKIKFQALASLALVIISAGFVSQVLAVGEPKTNEMETGSGKLISKVAPGEFLPISVKLINFGEGKRVDVDVDYQIIDENNVVVFSQSETVAVETTASFVKNIQIPLDLPSGKYIASSKITYKGQEVPAISKFEFTVERKIAGIFVSQFILYGTLTILIGIAFAVLSRLVMKRRFNRSTPQEYPKVPKKERIFYEIISDMITQMRSYVGDRAIQIASSIDGLVVDENNGRVLKINKDPAEIVSLLVLQYQKIFGKKMTFSPRQSDKETEELIRPVEKNLDIIRKYFDK